MTEIWNIDWHNIDWNIDWKIWNVDWNMTENMTGNMKIWLINATEKRCLTRRKNITRIHIGLEYWTRIEE
jgi:hypothetical protein